jgi:hypothetical protein
MPLIPSIRVVVVGLAASTVAASLPAWADDKGECLRAASQGQTLRDEHELVEARAQFRVCARQVCPTVVRRDCAGWLDAAERAVPTVVLSARTADGADIVDVAVRVDGAPLVGKLDGRALPVNPGPHAFHFQRPDGTSVDRQVVIKEGVQEQSVAVVFPGAPGVGAEREPASAPVRPDWPGPAPTPSSSSLPTVGLVVGAFGLVGLGAGGVLGGLALDDKNKARCDASGTCDPGYLGDARTLATGSTIAFIAGGALVATGAILILVAPKSDGSTVGTLTAAPLLGTNVGGIDLRGSF